jgi:Trehalase
MWELYSRLPDSKKQKQLAALMYPLFKENYRVWTTQVDIDHNLLCATPNNWDDNPRADLLFKEATDIPGQWNSWWDDLVKGSRDHFLEDPAASSQLAYGTAIMGRFAKILGKDQEAADWARQFQKHVQAIDTLWDEEKGYWIVTYRHTLKDKVLTSSILYPIFTDVCRDPARIRRVIESHILNPAEFNGRYPIPTVAYNDPRYYKQKPPRSDQEGGLWRGNIWMPEAWIIVKGLYKYGYEAEATDIARRLIDMMSHQAQFTQDTPQFASVPAEYYDSRNGQAQNIRRFSWTSAVAMDFLLGNYQNERMLGTNPERDRAINGHLREIFDFKSGKSLFRVKTIKTVFPLLRMTSADGLPIDQSAKVEFSFSDPAANFAGATIDFSADPSRWSVIEKTKDVPLKPDANGYYYATLGTELMLIPSR